MQYIYIQWLAWQYRHRKARKLHPSSRTAEVCTSECELSSELRELLHKERFITEVGLNELRDYNNYGVIRKVALCLAGTVNGIK